MPSRQRFSRRLIVLGLAVVGAVAVAVSIALASSGEHGTKTSQTLKLAPERLTDPKTPGRVVFVSDFERNGFPEWYVQALPGRASLVHGSPYDGKANARFEVRPGDTEPDTGSPRAEVSGPTFDEGDDLYVRDAIRVPPDNSFRGPWQLIQQLHENDWGGSPGVAVFLTTNRRLELGAGDGDPTFWEGPRLREGRWYDLVYRVKLSENPAVGRVEVWLNGRRQRLRNGDFRIHDQTIQTDSTYLKLGIYRSSDSDGTSVVEHDGVSVIAARH
jgi:hypothetical protein